MPMISYELRQKVWSIRTWKWEVVSVTFSESLARHEFKIAAKENPDIYLELIKVYLTEDCLEFTPKAS